jgi:hypothetical protein
MNKPAKPSPHSLHRTFRKWHRKLGVFAAFFIVFLSVTGIALNHTDGLSLAHQPIKSTWLLDHYGIAAPQDIRIYQQGNILVTHQSVWFKGALLLESDDQVISVGRMPLKQSKKDVLVIATSQSLLLYSLTGELVDMLGVESGVPESINALSIKGEQLILDTEQGYVKTDSNFFDWQVIQPITAPQWLQPEIASTQQIEQAKLIYRAQFLTLERIILDSHSGRILGDIGVVFMDFIALLLIVLSISGLYLWLKYAKNNRK